MSSMRTAWVNGEDDEVEFVDERRGGGGLYESSCGGMRRALLSPDTRDVDEDEGEDVRNGLWGKGALDCMRGM